MDSFANDGNTHRINNIEMYYVTLGTGTPLLLLHGFTGCSADWQYIFHNLPPGFRLIMPDLRGHGRSPGGADFSFRQCAWDVLALLDHLQVVRCRAIGLSGGAQVLLHMATQQPDRFAALVLVSTAHYFPEPARKIMQQMTPDERSESAWETMRARHKLGDAQIRTLWQVGHQLQYSTDDVNFTSSDLARITAPTLIVHGDRDPLYPLHIPREMQAAIPQSSLWIVPNGGHLPIFEERRAQFVRTVLPFLKQAWDPNSGEGENA